MSTDVSLSRRQGGALIAVGALWLLIARLLADWGAFALPASVRRHLTLQSYSILVLVVVTTIGLALARAVTPSPLRALGASRPRGWPVLAAASLAPLVLAVSAYLAYRIALPTLLEEIARGGRAAAERNTGAFGRGLAAEHAAITLTWAVVVTPIAEELVFRGALWSGITRLTAAPTDAPPSVAWMRRGRLAKSIHEALRRGGIATLITATVFAWMHADQSGGAGIVRVVQTAVLALSLGVARHASGGLSAPIALHAVFNALTIAKTRKWIVSEVWPHPLPIPWWWWQLAGLGTAVVALIALHRLKPRLRVAFERFDVAEVDEPQRAAWRDEIASQLDGLPPWWGQLDGPPDVHSRAEGDGWQTTVVTWFHPHSGLLWPAARASRSALVARLRRLTDAEVNTGRTPPAHSP